MGIFRPAALSKTDTRSIVERKLGWILSACDPREVWLFGSAARDSMTEASDVDLAVVFEDRATLAASRRTLYATPRPDEWPHDIVFLVAEDLYGRSIVGGLPMLIVEEGRKIYERGAS